MCQSTISACMLSSSSAHGYVFIRTLVFDIVQVWAFFEHFYELSGSFDRPDRHSAER